MSKPRFLHDSRIVMEDLARVRMELQAVHPNLKSLLVSGVSGGEGVTSVVATFAWLCARENQKVVIVDSHVQEGDLRNLFGSLDAADRLPHPPVIVHRNSLGNKSANLREQHELLKAEYDWVLWDSPALGVHSESMELAALVDGVLLVLAADWTKSDGLTFVKERLDRSKATIVGAIINRSGRYLPNKVVRRWLEGRKKARLRAGTASA